MANQKSQVVNYTPEVLEVYKPEVLEVIRNSICPTATDSEFVLFAHKAATYGLDPFKNEIFFIKYGNTARIQFAAEAYIAKAREKEGFQPPDTQIVCENDEFKARKVRREDGQDDWEIVEHEVTFPRGKIIGAYCIAYREGCRPVTVFVEKEHIEHLYKGQNKDNWIKWEPDMIGKFVQQRALKVQYGLDLNEDEISQVSPTDDVPEYRPEPRDITDQVITDKVNQATEEEKRQPKPEPQEEDEATKKARAKEELKTKFKQIGITNAQGRSKFFKDHNISFKDPKNPTLSEMTGVIKLLDMEIERNAEDSAVEASLLDPVE